MTLQQRKILANRWKHPDGTILQSFDRHHYVKYKDCFVDGGLSGYIRISGDLENCCVYTDSPFEQIREGFHWGTYGKDGDQPLKYKPLKDLDSDHIEAILATQTHLPDYIMDVFRKEWYYREKLK